MLSVFEGAVVWGNKKQNAVATSTVEAEFMAASLAVKEANWLFRRVFRIVVPPWSVTLHCDKQGCLANLKNPLYSKYIKDMAVSFCFAREAIAKGNVDVQYIESAKNMADILTKVFSKPVFQIHRKSLGLRNFP